MWIGPQGRGAAATVLLTVPHARCPPHPLDHECDFAALAAAHALADAFERAARSRRAGAFRLRPALVVPGPTEYRRVCDLNRRRCRDTTPYRRRLTADMSRPDVALLIDVHSFPPNTDRVFDDADVVILDDTAHAAWSGYAVALLRMLAAAHDGGGGGGGTSAFPVRVRLVKGAHNDIEEEARGVFGLPAILIEFNERLFADDARPRMVRMLADRVVRWAYATVPHAAGGVGAL